VGTGISVELPEGWEFQVRSKSGLAAKKGLMVLNSPGTIDESYRLEIKVILYNASSETVTLNAGSKVAQLVLAPVHQANFVLMDSTQRSGGMGSTGLLPKDRTAKLEDKQNTKATTTSVVNIQPGFAEGVLSLGG
jgi:dUTP pyrophosphatase